MNEMIQNSEKLRKRLIIIIWVLAGITLAGITVGGVMISEIYSRSGWHGAGSTQNEAKPSPDSGAGIEKYVSSVLIVVQNQALSNTSAAADMIFIVSFNALRQELTTAALMGEMTTESEYGDITIRELYARGGPDALKSVLNEKLGINIQNYACTDTYSLASMIDILGGITVRLTSEEAEYLSEALNKTVKPGKATLNGVQSMAHALDIRSGGDTPFSVAKRQLALVDSAVENMRETATKEAMLPLLSLVLSSIRTDLDIEALRGFAYEIIKAEDMEYAGIVLPIEDSWSYPEEEERAGLIVADWAANGAKLQDALYRE